MPSIDCPRDGGVCQQPLLGCVGGREEELCGANGFLPPSSVVLFRGRISLVQRLRPPVGLAKAPVPQQPEIPPVEPQQNQ